MTKLLQHIDEMRVRLNEIASSEQALVKALGDALNRLDQQLLRDVRTLSSEHEVRREAILGELQVLAGSIGMFPAPRAAVAAPEPRPAYIPASEEHANGHGNGYTSAPIGGHGNGYTSAPAGGHPNGADWRQAANNIQDDFDFHVDWHAPSH